MNCKHIIKLIFAVWLATLSAASSFAVQPEEILTDQNLETRARIISKDLRCLVCQNQSIDDSNAPLAKDLRLIVRERLQAGDSNAQVFDYIVARYGNYVLLQPPLQSDTVLLWISPFIILIASLGMVAVYLRKPQTLDSESEVKDD